jgi:hypothetical protein
MTQVRDISQRGTTAAKPAANSVDVGSLYFDTDLGKMQRSNGTSWEDCAETVGAAGYPTFSGASLTKSATQNISSGVQTAISFDGEVYDTDNYHDNVTNNTRLTAPSTGYYLVGGSAEMNGVNTTYWVITRLRKNGTNEDGDTRSRVYSPQTGAVLNTPSSRPVYLQAGDYVELVIEQNTGGNVPCRESVNGTSFWIVRIA